MKLLLFPLALLMAGCTTRPIEIAPIKIAVDVDVTSPTQPKDLKPNPILETLAKQAFGHDSIAGQIMLGCTSYLHLAGRWPRTKEEITEGLAAKNHSANRLSDLQSFVLTEKEGALFVEFVADGKNQTRGTVTLHPPNHQKSTPATPATTPL